MDILVIGALGVAGFYLLKRPGFSRTEGTLGASEDYHETEGAVKPNGSLGDLASQSSLTQQQDVETAAITPPVVSHDDYIDHVNSKQGQADILHKAGSRAFNPTGSNIISKFNNTLVNTMETLWKGTMHDVDVLRDKIKNVHQRSTLNAAVTSTNAFNPDRLTTVRNRPNGNPYIASFATHKTSITGHPTYFDKSPYTLTNYSPMDETAYASDRSGVRSDRATHVDVTPVVATAAPIKTSSTHTGAVKINMGNMQKAARKIHFNPKKRQDADPPMHASEHHQSFKRVLTKH